jgi:hypothetical protein
MDIEQPWFWGLPAWLITINHQSEKVEIVLWEHLMAL